MPETTTPRWFYGDHRYPIAPERESEWFANRYGLGPAFGPLPTIQPERDYWPCKFDSQLAEWTWEGSLDNAPIFSDEYGGESATLVTFGYYDLLSVFALLCDEFPRGDIPSAAIVWTASSGAVTVDWYDTEAEAEADAEAIVARVEAAADEACDTGDCQPCTEPQPCEFPYVCEHSAHVAFACERAEWLPEVAR